jgi:Mg2+ and Co2+ transporter CorA
LMHCVFPEIHRESVYVYACVCMYVCVYVCVCVCYVCNRAG